MNLIFACILVIVGISNHLLPSIETVLVLGKVRNGLLGLLLLLLLIKWFLKDQKANGAILLAGLTFPLYYMVTSYTFKDYPQLGTAILYFVWAVYVFILSRGLCSTSQQFAALLISAFLSSMTVLLFGVIAYFFGFTVEGGIHDRFSFGFENPNIYAQYCQIAIISGFLYLQLVRPKHKAYLVIYTVISICLIVAIYFAQSRNVMVGLAAFFSIYVMFNWKAKILAKIGIVVAFVMAGASIGFDKINSLSSGRLIMWAFYVNHSINQGTSAILFGARTNPDASSFVPTYSRLGKEQELDANQKKFHADNMLIELFVEAGIIGILLFVFPYFIIWRILRNREKFKKRIWSALIISLIVQGMLITNFTTFFAPISLFYASILVFVFTPQKSIFRRLSNKEV